MSTVVEKANGSSGSPAVQPGPPESAQPTSKASTPPAPPPNAESPAASKEQPHAPPPAPNPTKKYVIAALILVAVVVIGRLTWPTIVLTMNTVSTDDAYINGHMTMVAPRVSGQVAKVLVDDNMRVKKGDVLLQIDKEPFEIQVALKRDAVHVAEANLTAAEAQARSLEALAGAQRWKVQTAIQTVKNQIAELSARVAALHTKEATYARAKSDWERGKKLVVTNTITKEDFDQRVEAYRVAEAALNQAREEVYQVRVMLGLSREPLPEQPLTAVPDNLDETYSDVRSAFSQLVQTMAQLGLSPDTYVTTSPSKSIAAFEQLDREGHLDKTLAELVTKAPAVVQAKAALATAKNDLALAELNLRYCDIVAEVDGVVTGRNVNPGNNVQAGQSVLAVRSLTEIWIDANFKETQLAELRIGQRAKIELDMYGGKKEFEGRITGFTMGTGQTLSLLPPQNATGNFVKIVQRLPVRIELTDYDPAKAPIFVGLSATPYVFTKEPATGPHAGEMLQPPAALPTSATSQR